MEVEPPESFVLRHLPVPGSQVLEVGCGQRGDLAWALDAAGHRVVAIDPRAPDGPIFRRMTLEEFDADDPFDAIVASLSLHHVHDLEGGLDLIARLLRPDGVIVVIEHAFDLVDERTGRWYVSRTTDSKIPTEPEEFLRWWDGPSRRAPRLRHAAARARAAFRDGVLRLGAIPAPLARGGRGRGGGAVDRGRRDRGDGFPLRRRQARGLDGPSLILDQPACEGDHRVRPTPIRVQIRVVDDHARTGTPSVRHRRPRQLIQPIPGQAAALRIIDRRERLRAEHVEIDVQPEHPCVDR